MKKLAINAVCLWVIFASGFAVSGEMILVHAELSVYTKDAYRAHYDDGGHEVADSMEFKILAPEEYRNRIIEVYISPALVKLEYSKVGSQYEFPIQNDIFESEITSGVSKMYHFGTSNLPKALPREAQ